MTLDQIKTLTVDDLRLRQITTTDQEFIDSLFRDKDIAYYYIVPKEARQDHRVLVSYWLNDIQNGAGNAWIIVQKGKGLFSRDKNCGFIAFEFRSSVENARLSYALAAPYRGKGIVARSLETVMKALQQCGVKTFEADIDRDNVASERVVERLGFTANKREGLVDPEMLREGEIRIRALWKKRVNEEAVAFAQEGDDRMLLSASFQDLVPQINSTVAAMEQHGQHPALMARYLYLLGRIKFLEGSFDEASEAFGQCNMILMQNGLPDNHETFYWFARIREERKESKDEVLMYFDFALEKYTPSPLYMSRAEIVAEKERFVRK